MEFALHIITIIWCSFGICMSQSSLDGKTLSDKLKEIRDGAGVTHMQDFYDKLPFTIKSGDGHQLLQGIQSSIGSSLTEFTKSLNAVKQRVFDSESDFSSSTTLPMCCTKTGQHVYDPKFRHEVDFSTACVTKSPLTDNNAKFPPSDIGETMKTNYNNNKNILWQHYGTTYGTAIIYPSMSWKDCNSYDPRLRPAFATTASLRDKDVVIVISSSKSMKSPSGIQDKSMFVLAKEAARTVVQTLSPNDRIAALSFNSVVNKPSDCYSSTLSFATETNIKKLKEYISLISIQESNNAGRNFEIALKSAFEYLEPDINDTSRDHVILFVTDGGKTEGRDPVEVIRDENMKLQNKVVIFTYLIGAGASAEEKQQLEDMASQKLSNDSYGSITVGDYSYLESSMHDKLAIEMSTFYLHLSISQSDSPTYTVPYVDPFAEIGLMTSMCLPVRITDGFNGIACTDVKLSELLKEVEYFEEGNSSYAFLIDSTGRALVHPLLPEPTYVKDPVFVDISVLERSPNTNDIIQNMKSGGNGSKNVPTTYFTIPRGNLLNDGSSIRPVNATFYWGPIPVTNFLVCVVLGNELHSELSEIGYPITSEDLDNSFMYHNRNLTNDDFTNCRFNSRLVTLDRTSVKFTPSSFENPFQYLDKDETAEDVNEYRKYFSKKAVDNPGFKVGVRADVWATYELEKFWKTTDSAHLAWRYIGTTSGIMRAYPGVSLEKSYDHEKRAWFRQTLAHPGKMFLTPPYDDAWGSGILISLEHTIYKKNSEQITAVIGTDFPLQYFNWFIDRTYQSCTSSEFRCIIIEDSGFIVMHPSFKESTDVDKFKSFIHITVEEPELAKVMKANGVLNYQECQDFSANKERRTYRVTMPTGKSGGLDFHDTNDQFELRPIPETNIFILRQKSSSILNSDCSCDQNLKPDSRECRQCDCLCYSKIVYNFCKNMYNIDDSLPCSPQVPDTSGTSTPEVLDNLKNCYTPKCHEKQSKTECFSEAQCGWCEFTDTGNELNPKCCRLKEDCSFGKTKSSNRDTCKVQEVARPNPTDSPKESASVSTEIVVGSVCAGIIATLILVGIMYFVRRRNLCNKNNDDIDPYIDPIPDRNGYESGIFEDDSNVSCSTDGTSSYTKPPDYPVSSNNYVDSMLNRI